MVNKRISILYLPILFILLVASCKEDDISPDQQYLKINNFIWEEMNDVYLWEEFIPQDIDLKSETDSKHLFEELLYLPTDRWSYITDDYQGLIDGFNGVEKDFGHHFKLYKLFNSDQIVGIVKYVVSGSPASDVGIQRGDLFYKVNGTTLDVNNYEELLFGQETYTLSFGTFDVDENVIPGTDKSLTAKIIIENPIYLSKTIEFEESKIGYLAYNRFISKYEDDLVKAIQKFKNDNITDLVLDLRYNPGGAVSSAIHLSSLIAPNSVVQNESVFSRLQWNEKYADYFLKEEGADSENLVSHFIIPAVNLNLNRIYILITSNTASASEAVINSLNPYMEVVVIGSENSSGKYVGSVTIHDANKSGNWAMQPIVFKNANADGVSDYADGFTPDYLVEDDYNAPLGSLGEDMLSKAVELITGQVVTEPARIESKFVPDNMTPIANMVSDRKKEMYLDVIH